MDDATLLKIGGMATVGAVAIACLALNRSDGILTVVAGFVGGLFIGQEIGKQQAKKVET